MYVIYRRRINSKNVNKWGFLAITDTVLHALVICGGLTDSGVEVQYRKIIR